MRATGIGVFPNYRARRASANLAFKMSSGTSRKEEPGSRRTRFEVAAARARNLMNLSVDGPFEGIQEMQTLLERLAQELAEAAALDCLA